MITTSVMKELNLRDTIGQWSIHTNVPFLEAAVQRCSVKRWPEACNFIKKETLTQVFSWEFYEIFKSSFLKEHIFL